jgi:hypothetical protein
MLKKDEQFKTKTNKRVHWDETAKDNEGKTRAKKQKTAHSSQENSNFCQKSIEKITDSLKPHLFKSSSPQLKEMLDRYSPEEKVSILSTGDLFNAASIAGNIEALCFIREAVPQNVACNMLHNENAFMLFLCHEYTLEKLAKSDHQRRVEGFKVFLKIDHENIQKTFNIFDSKWRHTTYQLSLKGDFSTALTQLQEEGILSDDELNTTEELLPDNEHQPSKNALLKHLEDNTNTNLGGTNLNLYSSADHRALSPETTKNSNGSDKGAHDLNKVTKKAVGFANTSNTSLKTL